MIVITLNGRASFELGDELGTGGEGIVHRLIDNEHQVVKLSRVPTTESWYKKLQFMIENPPVLKPRPDGRPALAWPMDFVRSPRSRQPIGFTMPYVTGQTWYEFCNPKRSHVRRPVLRHKLVAMYNLAYVVKSAHDKSYVVGDINRKNVLVNRSGSVSVIDTDSFQVWDGLEYHSCKVAHPEYVAPEISGTNFGEIIRSNQSDLFGLAVLMFQALHYGSHPYRVIPSQSSVSLPTIPIAMSNGWTAIHNSESANYRWGRPRDCPPLGALSPELQNLFVRAFIDGHKHPELRPSAAEWMETVRSILKNEHKLRDCEGNDTKHQIFSESSIGCYECTMLNRVRPRLLLAEEMK